MKISELDEPVISWALSNQMSAGNVGDKDRELSADYTMGNFRWSDTPEGLDFWINVDNGYSVEKLKENYPDLPWEDDGKVKAAEINANNPTSQFRIINDIEEPIRTWALNNQEKAGNTRNQWLNLQLGKSSGNFTWSNTPENHGFWFDVVRGKSIEYMRSQYPEFFIPQIKLEDIKVGCTFNDSRGKIKEITGIDTGIVRFKHVISNGKGWIKVTQFLENLNNGTNTNLKDPEPTTEKKYKFNEGDLVVFDKLADCYVNFWWIREGELVVLGGRHWDSKDRDKLDRCEVIGAISKKRPKGSGADNLSCVGKFRHVTELERKWYEEKGIGANIKDMPKVTISVPAEAIVITLTPELKEVFTAKPLILTTNLVYTRTDTINDIIFRWGIGDSKSHIVTNHGNPEFVPKGGGFRPSKIKYRLATEHEIRWLEECEKANALVDKPLEEFITNVIYTIKNNMKPSSGHIFRWGATDNVSSIHSNGLGELVCYSNRSGSYKSALKSSRVATEEESAWLELCEAADKFVEKPVKKVNGNAYSGLTLVKGAVTNKAYGQPVKKTHGDMLGGLQVDYGIINTKQEELTLETTINTINYGKESKSTDTLEFNKETESRRIIRSESKEISVKWEKRPSIGFKRLDISGRQCNPEGGCPASSEVKGGSIVVRRNKRKR